MVYPFVLAAVYPSSTTFVQVDVDPAIVLFIMLQSATGNTLADSALRDSEPAGGLLNSDPVAVRRLPLVLFMAYLVDCAPGDENWLRRTTAG